MKSKKKEAALKDKIIRFLIEMAEQKRGVNSKVIASELKADLFDVVTYCEDLEKAEYISRIGENKPFFSRSDMLEVRSRGQHFLMKKGGFKDEFKEYRKMKHWEITKVIAVVVNAVFIIVLTALSIYNS